MSSSVVCAAFRARWRREKVAFQGCVGELRRRDEAGAGQGFGVVWGVGRWRAASRSRVLGGAWVLGIHARARGGHRARLRERSAPELTERVTEGPALGTAAHLPRPSRGLSTKAGSGDGWLAITVSW